MWNIWPAVLLHTLFATAIVYTWMATKRAFHIPNVMLTVMGAAHSIFLTAPHLTFIFILVRSTCRSRNWLRHLLPRHEWVCFFLLCCGFDFK
jgi:hypothetical protein